jgi:hypothetical protein
MDIEAVEDGRSLHSFTPVRRRESTINKRQFQGDQEQEWTAARCHRLLRVLTSRVAILNKELSRFSSVAQNEKEQTREISKREKGAASTRADADWARARTRIRQTYSKKGTRIDNDLQKNIRKPRGPSAKGRQSLIPGEIAVPTPILARARGELLAEEVLVKAHDDGALREPVRRNKRARTRYLAIDGESNFQLSESLLELRRRITATRYSTYEGIYNGLEALLRATTTTQSRRKGPDSLLAMSLRAMPRYIIQQQALLQAHMEKTGSKSAIENRDISAEIYGELETLGTFGNGWKRLRTIVRSHGIQVVSDAILAGLLDVEFSGALIALCVNISAVEEAQTLLSVLLTITPCLGPKTTYDIPCRPVAMLCKYTEHTGRYSFQYKQLSRMVSNGILPVEWLATKEFGPVWTRVIHSLAPSSDHVEAMIFLDLALAMLSVTGTPSARKMGGAIIEAARNTFSSLLTILSSVVILSRGAETSGLSKEIGSSREYEHVSSLLRSCLVQQSHSNIALTRPSPLILLANLFAHDVDGISADFLDSLGQMAQQDDGFAASSLMYSSVVDFICLVARCCGRGTSNSGFEHLQHLHLLLESFINDIEGGNALKGLIIDSAFAFAQKVPDHKHIDYATAMDERFCERRFGEHGLLAEPTSNFEELKTGFRWEEGIGEWVTATPAIHIAKRSIVEASCDSEDDTPFRPPPKLRRAKCLVKESTVNCSLVHTDGYVDVSDMSIEKSEGVLDELGSVLDNDGPADHESSPGSDDESATQSQSSSLFLSDELTGSTSDVEGSLIEASYISNHSSSIIATDRPSFERHHDAVDRAPRLSRRLFRDTRDWSLFDEGFTTLTSPLLPNENSDSEVQRGYVDRAPRLGRRALRSSQAWQMFDESDDELSFLSVSSQGDQVLQDITNTAVSSSRCLRRANQPPMQKRSVPVPRTDSEDELCI